MAGFEGIEKFQRNLAAAVRQIKGRTLQGVIAATAHLGAAALEKTPIEFGILRNSQIVSWGKIGGGRISGSSSSQPQTTTAVSAHTGKSETVKWDKVTTTVPESAEGEPVGAVAYQAAYAPFVHENLEANHPQGEAKFLERAADENQSEIVLIIASAAKV